MSHEITNCSFLAQNILLLTDALHTIVSQLYYIVQTSIREQEEIKSLADIVPFSHLEGFYESLSDMNDLVTLFAKLKQLSMIKRDV